MDAELAEQIKLARSGNVDAFAYVVAAFSETAVRIAGKYVPGRHTGEDAAQEAFIQAFHHLGSLRDVGAFPGWFARIVRTCAIRAIRGRRPDLLELNDPPAAESNPIEEAELTREVRRAIRGLTPRQRSVIERHYLNGQSVAEIGRELKLPKGTVKRRLFDAREKLRTRLSGFVAGGDLF